MSLSNFICRAQVPAVSASSSTTALRAPGRHRPRWRPQALAAAALCGLFIGAAGAQPGEPVTVTATRVPTPVSALVAEITVLDRAAIERAEGRTLAELLAQQPGLQLSSNGGLGKTSSLFIRGLEARHTLLLIDGVPLSSSTVGTPSLDNLPLESIERIEIVRGPLSSVYGSGAMGGVIQVFTRRGRPGLTGQGKLSLGSNDYRQAAAGVSAGDSVFDLAAQVQHTDTQGRSASNPGVPFGSYNPDRDGFRQTGGSLRLGWQPQADARVELVSLQSRGLTRFDDGPGADARAEIENRVLALSAQMQLNAAWNTRLRLSESVDAFDTLASASRFASLGVIQTRRKQLSWENTWATPLGALLALAERSQEQVSRPGQPFAVSERDIDGLALGLSGRAAQHSWQASLRRDRNSQFGGASTGALGWGYALSPAWRLGASLGSSFVVPSFNQLYFPNFGSPNLQPEKGRHGELSLRWAQGAHSLRGAVYQHRYRGFITSGPQPSNLPRVEIDGFGLSYETRLAGIDWAASLDHTDPRNATQGNANLGRLLPRRAQRAARLAGDWQRGDWTLGATLAAFSHRFDNAANSLRLAGYGTLDLRAEWALAPQWKLGLRLNNAGGKAYETALGYDQPGREGLITLRYTPR